MTKLQTLPCEILNSLQFYLGENEVLDEVCPESIDTQWIHKIIEYNDDIENPEKVLKLRIKKKHLI